MEARSEIPNVENRTDTRGRKQPAKKSTKKPEAKQPVRKPVKHDDRVISPVLGERVGRLAYGLIRLDINLVILDHSGAVFRHGRQCWRLALLVQRGTIDKAAA
jgi:hypothetical protein